MIRIRASDRIERTLNPFYAKASKGRCLCAIAMTVISSVVLRSLGAGGRCEKSLFGFPTYFLEILKQVQDDIFLPNPWGIIPVWFTLFEESIPTFLGFVRHIGKAGGFTGKNLLPHHTVIY